jgi:hypothetical protein
LQLALLYIPRIIRSYVRVPTGCKVVGLTTFQCYCKCVNLKKKSNDVLNRSQKVFGKTIKMVPKSAKISQNFAPLRQNFRRTYGQKGIKILYSFTTNYFLSFKISPNLVKAWDQKVVTTFEIWISICWRTF